MSWHFICSKRREFCLVRVCCDAQSHAETAIQARFAKWECSNVASAYYWYWESSHASEDRSSDVHSPTVGTAGRPHAADGLQRRPRTSLHHHRRRALEQP